MVKVRYNSHMTNTLNTPVEALEYSYPFMVTEYAIRKNSGGKGRFLGGDGLVRQMRMESDAEVTVLSERTGASPLGPCRRNAGKMRQQQHHLQRSDPVHAGKNFIQN